MTARASANEASALGHIRVVEIGDIPASYATRLLADLGADVIKVEPPGGDPNRWLPLFAGNIEDPERSLTFINANTNKRSIVLDLANSTADRETFATLLASADLFVEATPLGQLEALSFTDERLQEIHQGLVTVSLTPFGRTGPYRSYKGSDAVANAMGGFLFAQGDDTRGPCTAPCHLAYQMAACLAAALGLAGLRLPHMWREFTQKWMPETVLARPEWEDLKYHEAHSEEVSKIFAEFISQFTADDFSNEAQQRHLAAAPLNTVGQFVDCAQVREREWLQVPEHPVIGRYTAPGFPMRLSATPMRIRRPAPLLGQHQAEILAELKRVRPKPVVEVAGQEAHRPMLECIRIADLTQQFAGPLGTAMLAYYGMEVIKVESNEVPNRGRATAVHADMNRAKLGCTINLRHPEGKELFKQLVSVSDVVVDNFSAGITERLGFSFAALQE